MNRFGIFLSIVLAALNSASSIPGIASKAQNLLLPLTQSTDVTSSGPVSSSCSINPPPPDRSQDRFSAPEIIHAAGFPNETHKVTTSDGYILTLHRIRKDGGTPLFLLHGILCSSRDFLMQRGNNSLPYQLWLAGYDVWIGNMRGNAYSLGHETIQDPKNNASFWDFSFDEIAQKDNPTMIDYILENTNNTELQCVGYSLGTTTLIAGLIKLPEYQKKCTCFTGLAPVTLNGNVSAIAFRGPAIFAQPEEPLRSFLYGSSPTGEFQPPILSNMMHQYFPEFCQFDKVGLCQNLAYALLGVPDPSGVDDEMEPKIYAGFPSSTSIRNYIQVAYTITQPREFREYVYQTVAQNLRKYGTPSSPVYNLSNFHTPTTLFVGPADQVATVLDVNAWSPKLGTTPDVVYVDDPAWGHIDVLFAKDACEKLYTPVLQKLQSCGKP